MTSVNNNLVSMNGAIYSIKRGKGTARDINSDEIPQQVDRTLSDFIKVPFLHGATKAC